MLSLAGCGGSGDSEELEEAIAVGRLDTVELRIDSEDDKALFEPGEQWQFFALSIDSDGQEQLADEGVQWSTSDPAIATVDGNGLVQVSASSTDSEIDVSASLGQYNDSYRISVSTAPLASIEITPNSDPLAECQSTMFTAQGTYTDGSQRPLIDGLSWTTNDSAVATFSENLLRSHNSGTVTARAQASTGVAGSYPLTVTDTLASLDVSTDSSLRLLVDESAELTAMGAYTGGTNTVDITANSQWSSADSSVATVSAEGLVEAIDLGSTTISVTCGGINSDVTVAVVEADGIAIVDPLAGTVLVEGETRELELYRSFSDGELGSEDVASEADWIVTVGTSVANVDGNGVITMADDFTGYTFDHIRVRADFEDDSEVLEIPVAGNRGI